MDLAFLQRLARASRELAVRPGWMATTVAEALGPRFRRLARDGFIETDTKYPGGYTWFRFTEAGVAALGGREEIEAAVRLGAIDVPEQWYAG